MEIVVRENEIVVSIGQETIGKLVFSYLDDKTVEVISTYVESKYRGQGIANTLMNAFVEWLEKQGLQCVPSCSYALDWFLKNPLKQTLVKEKEL